MTQIFADTTKLEEGDVAVIIRNDGRVQLASNVSDAQMESPLHGARCEQHMFRIMACYRMLMDPAYDEHMLKIGSAQCTLEMIAPE